MHYTVLDYIVLSYIVVNYDIMVCISLCYVISQPYKPQSPSPPYIPEAQWTISTVDLQIQSPLNKITDKQDSFLLSGHAQTDANNSLQFFRLANETPNP